MSRREFDRGSLGAGVFFIVAGIVFLLDELDVITLSASYLLPVLLIALGAAIVIGSVSPRRGP